MLSKGKRRWNVIFLLDQSPPARIVFLKRSPEKKFAPNMYTGIGGGVEANETILESAYRELHEETGLQQIQLYHFADCVIDDGAVLSYFSGFYIEDVLPDCNEGNLEWVETSNLFTKDIIPTTKNILKTWQEKQFDTKHQWTMFCNKIGEVNGMRQTTIVRVIDGLYNG